MARFHSALTQLQIALMCIFSANYAYQHVLGMGIVVISLCLSALFSFHFVIVWAVLQSRLPTLLYTNHSISSMYSYHVQLVVGTVISHICLYVNLWLQYLIHNVQFYCAQHDSTISMYYLPCSFRSQGCRCGQLGLPLVCELHGGKVVKKRRQAWVSISTECPASSS